LALDSQDHYLTLRKHGLHEERTMLRLFERLKFRPNSTPERAKRFRCLRPSLVDLRFTGDPWVVDHADGTASVRLDNYRLAAIRTMPFDLPSLNRLLLQLRQWQMRRQFKCQLRANPRAV
jgi:hypothetical protein